MASAKAKIRHVFGDTFSCRAAPPDILVKLSGAKLCKSLGKPRDKGEGTEKKEGDKEANTDAAMHVTMGTQVFLQTAQVTVTGPELGSSDGLKVRALFDTGAQRSYVSKGVADKLGLETVQTGQFGYCDIWG